MYIYRLLFNTFLLCPFHLNAQLYSHDACHPAKNIFNEEYQLFTIYKTEFVSNGNANNQKFVRAICLYFDYL